MFSSRVSSHVCLMVIWFLGVVSASCYPVACNMYCVCSCSQLSSLVQISFEYSSSSSLHSSHGVVCSSFRYGGTGLALPGIVVVRQLRACSLPRSDVRGETALARPPNSLRDRSLFLIFCIAWVCMYVCMYVFM